MNASFHSPPDPTQSIVDIHDAILPAWKTCASPSGAYLALLQDDWLWVRGVSPQSRGLTKQFGPLPHDGAAGLRRIAWSALSDLIAISFPTMRTVFVYTIDGELRYQLAVPNLDDSPPVRLHSICEMS